MGRKELLSDDIEVWKVYCAQTYHFLVGNRAWGGRLYARMLMWYS